MRIGNSLRHKFHIGDFGLGLTSFLDREQGQIVLVLQNRHPRNDYRLRVEKPGGGGLWLELAMERKSLATVLFQL